MDNRSHDVGSLHPGISMHHIPVGSGVAGFLFVAATVFIFGMGIPAFLQILVITGTTGTIASSVIFYWHKRHAVKIHSLDLHKSGTP